MNEFDNLFTDEDIATEGLFDKFKNKNSKDSSGSKYANKKATKEICDEIKTDEDKILAARKKLMILSSQWFDKANKSPFLSGVLDKYVKFNNCAAGQLSNTNDVLDKNGNYPIHFAYFNIYDIPDEYKKAAMQELDDWKYMPKE